MYLFAFAISIFLSASNPANAFNWPLGSGGVKYPDEEMKDFHPKIKDRYLKMRSLLEKGQKCVVGIDGFMERYFRMEVRDNYLPNSVTCIADIVVDPNTLREKSGCSLVRYNLDTDNYVPFFNKYFPQAMASKACGKGGFEELMQMRGWWFADAWQNSTVEETIFTPKTTNEPWQFLLIYAKDSEKTKWFMDARTRVKTFVDEKLKNSKKEGKK